MSEWQDISTAPMDWRGLIIYDPDTTENSTVGEGYFAPLDYDGDGEWHWATGRHAKPTHWMPLPDPPARANVPEAQP